MRMDARSSSLGHGKDLERRCFGVRSRYGPLGLEASRFQYTCYRTFVNLPEMFFYDVILLFSTYPPGQICKNGVASKHVPYGDLVLGLTIEGSLGSSEYQQCVCPCSCLDRRLRQSFFAIPSRSSQLNTVFCRRSFVSVSTDFICIHLASFPGLLLPNYQMHMSPFIRTEAICTKIFRSAT